ncbi:MAG: GNAT family N-acetyltransferase [Clostridia bacterium]|nr:GNAT family N-acetyltransferase [Clostridia bacterium]MBR1685068.1 GNAT family N-acetyltransferase [Clostridia bacterium]
MHIRRFQEGDAQAISDLIALTLRTTNSRDYDAEYLEEDIRHLQPEDIKGRAAGQHFYVVEENGSIVGCGAIGSYWGSETESSLFTIFVHPSFQGRGIGRQIIQTLEQDPYFLRANRVEIPASITAVPFYMKMGYTCKGGSATPDEERLVRMEKHRQISS